MPAKDKIIGFLPERQIEKRQSRDLVIKPNVTKLEILLVRVETNNVINADYLYFCTEFINFQSHK